MPHPLKHQMHNGRIVLTTAILVGLLLVPSALAAGKLKRFSKPIPGPELSGPISSIGSISPVLNDPDAGKQGDAAYGAFQRGYYLTALKLALPRAESGDPAAQTLIAELYWRGLGVGRDLKEGARWYAFAAQAGSREAQFSYGNILLRGKVVPQNKEKGEEFLAKAAKAGHAQAAFNLAQIYTARRPTWAGFQIALPFYRTAAEAGVADAQYALANIYAEAKGVQFNDDEIARMWLEKAAEGGLDSAQVDLGIWLINGRGGEKNVARARLLFTLAAARGNVVAQNRLARMYAFGIGTPVDQIQAGAWHIMSRRAGFTDSELDRVFQGLSKIDQKRAIEAANQLSRRLRS